MQRFGYDDWTIRELAEPFTQLAVRIGDTLSLGSGENCGHPDVPPV